MPDHISLWGSLLKFRREFDQYINLRPARMFAGVPCPLADRGPGDIDFMIVRENTEGEYSSVGGVMFEGTERELVMQQSMFTRHGTERVLQLRLRAGAQRERAARRPSPPRATASRSACRGGTRAPPRWPRSIPTSRWDKQHIDILCARFVLQPQRFDVVVASNLFGDILSDLGPACTGTIGLAPSANLNPERRFPVAVRARAWLGARHLRPNIANPVAMIWSGAMMLDFLGTARGRRAPRTTPSSRRSRTCWPRAAHARPGRPRIDHRDGHGDCRRGRASRRSADAAGHGIHLTGWGPRNVTLQLDRSDLLLTQNFIAGRWSDAREGQRYAVIDPASDAPIAESARQRTRPTRRCRRRGPRGVRQLARRAGARALAAAAGAGTG